MKENIENIRKLTIFGSYAEILSYPYRQYIRLFKEDKPIGFDNQLVKQNSIKSSIRRAKRNLQLLVYSNHEQYGEPTLFLTLTRQKILTVQESYNQFKNFIQNINYQLTLKQEKIEVNAQQGINGSGLKYVNIIETQARSSPHFHTLLFNFPYIQNNQKFFHDYWGSDRLMVKPVYNIHGSINYLIKYISAQSGENYYYKRKRFTVSKNLKQPVVIKDDVLIQMAKWTLDSYKVKEVKIDTSFPGQITQSIFHFPYKNILDVPGLVREVKNEILDNKLLVA